MLKKAIFTTFFLIGASAFAIFIPLQKDGSVRWSGDGAVSAPTLSETERQPAGQDDNYVPAPVPYYQPPAEVPQRPVEQPIYRPPVVVTPPPVRVNRYSCIQQGYRDAGFPNASTALIDSVAARHRMHSDNGFRLFNIGGSAEARFKDGLKATIYSLAAIGDCSGKYSHNNSQSRQLAAILQSPDRVGQDYDLLERTLGWDVENVIPSNYADQYNPNGISFIRSRFASRSTPPVRQCMPRGWPGVSSVRKLCRALFASCARAGYNLGGNCEPVEDRDSGGSDNNGGNNNGGNNGSTTGDTNGTGNGNTNGNTSGNNGSQGETGEGSNAESGHGSDGSNNGGSQGNGPPGG